MTSGRLTAEQAFTIQPAPGVTSSISRTNLVPSAEQGVALPGASTDFTSGAGPTSMSLVGGPGCMTLAEALAAMQCISDPSSSPACNLFTPQQLALPLCPGEMPPPLPTCADADAQAGIAYCNQYGANGPNPALNGLCWLSSKYPVWYSALKALPPCAGTGPDLPPPKKADEAGNKTLVWGGILVALLLVGGGVYYYTSKKKK